MTPDQEKQAAYRRHRIAYGREFERFVGREGGTPRGGKARTYHELEEK